MNNDTEFCPHCGARLKSYRVTVTPLIVHALVKFRQAVIDKNSNEVHLIDDMKNKPYELSKHEWNNFSRQRFLGLAVKVEDRPGYWLLTRRGSQFLNGEIQIPLFVKIFRNKIIERSEVMVDVSKVIGSTPYMESKPNIIYEQVEEGQLSLIR